MERHHQVHRDGSKRDIFSSSEEEKDSDVEDMSDSGSADESGSDNDYGNESEYNDEELKKMIRSVRKKTYPIFKKKVNEYIENGLSEKKAMEKAKAETRKADKSLFLDRYEQLFLMNEGLKTSQKHGIIRNKIKDLRDDEEFSTAEAIKYVLHKRRYLFDDLFDEVAMETDDDNDDDNSDESADDEDSDEDM